MGLEVHTFPKDINPKMNVIPRLEFKLAYSDVVVPRANHYAIGTSFPSIQTLEQIPVAW